MQIIINAGGAGSRLWPLSTKNQPKQFSTIVGDQTLIQQTVQRLQNKFSDIWVATNINYQDLAVTQLSSMIDINKILIEPSRRDTFGAILAHSALVASHTSMDETLMLISSDHYIDNEIDLDRFCNALQETSSELRQNHYDIILPATKPYFASTEYGYIQFDRQSKLRINPVTAFKEKPDQSLAQEFLADGQYFWNLGYYAFSYKSLYRIVARLYPELLKVLDSIYTKQRITLEDYEQFPKLNFEEAIVERVMLEEATLARLGTIDMELTTWDDIGNFETLCNYLPEAEDLQHTLEVSGTGNKVKLHTNKSVALVGVSGLIIIENENGLLIMNAHEAKASDIRQVSKYFDI